MAKVYSYRRPKNIKKTIFELLKYLGHHRLTLLLVALLVCISSIANLLGTFSIKIVVDKALSQDYYGLLSTCLIVAFNYLLGALSTLLYTQMMVFLAQKVVLEMRRDAFNKLMKLPLKYFDNNPHGDIMSKFTNDMETISEALNNSFASTVEYFVQLVGTTICIFILSWVLSLIVMIFYILLAIYLIYAGKKSKYYFKKQQDSLGELSSFSEESIVGMKVIKVFNHEEESLNQFQNISSKLENSSIRALSFSNSMVPMVMSFSYFNYALVATLGGIIAINNLFNFSISALASYLVFTRQTSVPINRFTQQANIILNALASSERIFALIAEKAEIDEGHITLVKKDNKSYWKDGDILIPLKGDVRFDHVSFAYNDNKYIIKDLTLYAKKGQTIAFVGSTGAGKTTITNLINRFYEINNGTITYDGIDIRKIKKDDLRRSLGIVLQDVHLFSATINENINFGNNLNEEEIVKSSKLANAHSFIKRLPKGYQTFLSSDGGNLSVGQRQLISIARAAAINPEVLILDEATSSIDTYTEKLIKEGMDKLMKNRTVFVIAHRLSTVRNADCIIVLENGKIIEKGTHEELLQLHKSYYELYHGKRKLN